MIVKAQLSKEIHPIEGCFSVIITLIITNLRIADIIREVIPLVPVFSMGRESLKAYGEDHLIDNLPRINEINLAPIWLPQFFLRLSL